MLAAVLYARAVPRVQRRPSKHRGAVTRARRSDADGSRSRSRRPAPGWPRAASRSAVRCSARDGAVLGRGHNRRVQDDDPSMHGETAAFRNAGRQRSYRGTTMVTTLSPCWYCSGLVRQFGISRVVIGEARTFYGGHDWLAENGVEVVLLDDPSCVQMMTDFIAAQPGAVERGHRRRLTRTRRTDPIVRDVRHPGSGLRGAERLGLCGLEDPAQHAGGLLDGGPVDVEVGQHPHAVGADGADQDALLAGGVDQRRGRRVRRPRRCWSP